MPMSWGEFNFGAHGDTITVPSLVEYIKMFGKLW